MRVAVFGLWHLGSVTAACTASAGHDVVGLDPDPEVVAGLAAGRPPLFEPGLEDLLAKQEGRLRFTTDPADALKDADVLWVTFDTPVDDQDRADVQHVRDQLQTLKPHLADGTVVLLSSQVPVGFSRALRADWPGVSVACSPENLRLGGAIKVFLEPDRVVVGADDDHAKDVLAKLITWTDQVEWMSAESAEMTKHAINAFLATSVTFANELARLCERTQADAGEVTRGLKSESRIGRKAYVAPGPPFAGGTLARDVRFLQAVGAEHHVDTPLFDGLIASNAQHGDWARDHLQRILDRTPGATIAVLGLTYKPGTDTLRRSGAVELATWAAGQGATVVAFDPAVPALPPELADRIELAPDAESALARADAAVLATAWPVFGELDPSAFAGRTVIDQQWYLRALAEADDVTYIAPGRGGAA